MTGLAPTATALAGYFCISDLILIAQCLYYNTINARQARQRTQSTETDATDASEEPLLGRRRRTSSAGLPGSLRRHSIRHSEESGFDSLKRVVTGEDDTPDRSPWLHNTLGIAAIWIVGAAGWFVSYRVGAWDGPETPDDPTDAETPVAVVGMVLGYASAVCYLWSVQHFPKKKICCDEQCC